MDMDDPWGSPWADEIQHPVITTKKDNGEGEEVRPSTRVKAPALGLEVKPDSPWDDEDDEFGEWAAVPTVEEGRGNGMGLDGGSDAWETRDNGHKGGEGKEQFDGLDLSWNDNTAIPDVEIPKLAPSLTPKTAEIIRQPSPDPWATEMTLDDEHRDEDIRRPDTDQEDTPEELIGEVANGVDIEEAITSDKVLPEPAETAPASRTTDESDLETADSAERGHLTLNTEAIPALQTNTTRESDLRGFDLTGGDHTPEPSPVTANGHDAGQESSRPSSSPSDHSHHDEILSESPRTSFDEEPKRPQASRKVSSKIQELVEHFDGLAKQEEDELVIEPRTRTPSKTPSGETEKRAEDPEDVQEDGEAGEAEAEAEAEDDEDDDFGDFEDGQSEVKESTRGLEVERPTTPAPIENQLGSSPASKAASPQAQVSPPRSRYVKKDYGRVEFAADAAALNNINSPPGTHDAEDRPVERVFIMDTIPYDSFASTEERKTWYRISRYGSMRKHNSGDDENYVRVNWPQSQIRDQTLKTVGRWMEEDRISGRVVLGGGSKGSSIFGWNDSNAQAVPLDSVFAAKRGKRTPAAQASVEAAAKVPREWPKGLVRDRSPSKARSPSNPRRQSSVKSMSISESHKTSPQVPVANFGWNTNPTTKSQSPVALSKERPKAAPIPMKAASPPRNSSSLDSQPIAPIIPMSQSTQPQQPTDIHGPHNPPALRPSLLVLAPTLAPVSSEDDDWGEMVASPVLATAPTLPPTPILQHNKSQSLTGAFAPSLQVSPVLSPSAPGHESTMSFNDILVLKPRNSLESKSDPLPSNAFTIASPSSFFAPAIQASPSPVLHAADNSDPWASADFSFFDSPAPAPKAAPISAPAAKPLVAKSVSFAKAPAAPSPLRHGKTRQEIEQDEIVAGIVRGLPNLSYMLRR